MVYTAQENYLEAIELYKTSITIEQRKLGLEDVHIKETLFQLSKMYNAMGNEDGSYPTGKKSDDSNTHG